MTALIGLIALLVTLAGVLVALGHGGYLAMISSAARKRAGGQPAVDFVRKRLPVAAGTTAVTLLALLISSAESVPVDVFAILLGGGGGLVSLKALQGTQSRFRSGQY